MRFLIPLTALILCGISLAVETQPHTADSPWCRHGLCRFDQMYEAASAGEMSAAQVAALLQQDPNNPDAWCTFAEFQALHGNDEKAAHAFEHALALAPEIPSVAMRAANFYFTHNRRDDGFRMATRILALTRTFDEVLFSYMMPPASSSSSNAGPSIQEQAQNAIPPLARPARSWLSWMIHQEAPQAQLFVAWKWLQNRRLADTTSATSVVNEFWRRKDYETAQTIWDAWQRSSHPARDPYQLLNNPNFAEAPLSVPLDWTFASAKSVEVTRDQSGLDVHFLGTDNIDFRQVQQSAAVRPGRYRLTAEISSENLTTDQKPFFFIWDADSANRFHVESDPTPANTSHTTLSLTFSVPPQTHAVNVQLVRLQSSKFDSKIEGHLRIHAVHLSAL